MAFYVVCGSTNKVRTVFEFAYPTVTSLAQQPSNLSCIVTVVYRQCRRDGVDLHRLLLTANCTATLLALQHLLVRFHGETKLFAKMFFSVLFISAVLLRTVSLVPTVAHNTVGF